MTPVVAVDGGARASCAPLLAVPGIAEATWAAMGAGAEDASAWAAPLGGARALICGTSDSAQGRAIEGAARRAARRAGLRIVAVEDFPGNYWDLAGGEADAVVTESEASAAHLHGRLRERCPALWILPSPRYDALRARSAGLRARYARRDRRARRVLWAGQPETADALATLRRLLPALAESGVGLLFRAHPRDPGFARGDYRALLAGAALEVRDATPMALDECLALAPELVLTQFSSIGVEAGFHGIPSLHLLYEDAGARSLRAKKGLSEPPWCASGAAFVLRAEGGERALLRSALDDEAARDRAIAAFDRYFAREGAGLPALVSRLYNEKFIEPPPLRGPDAGANG